MPREMSDQLREAINQSSFGTDDVKQARQSVTAEETATLQRKIAQKRGTPVTDLTTTHLKFLLNRPHPGRGNTRGHNSRKSPHETKTA